MAAVVSEKMMDPTPVSAPPISQSMLNRNSSKCLPVDAESGSTSADSPDRLPASTSTSSPPDPQSEPPSRVEEYRQLFRLPSDEILIQDFNCALQENFLLQGHMYLFVHHICFYSNLFGFETKKVIPFHEITSVKRAKAVAVFPTAIEIIAGGKKYFFTSFLFRDEAFKLINEGWFEHNNGSKEIADQQETKTDVSIQVNASSVVQGLGSSRTSMDESDIMLSDRSGSTMVEFEPMVRESEIVSISPDTEVRDEATIEASPVTECSSSEKFSGWESMDADAPGVPEGFTKVSESKFPGIGIQEFFNLFFSDAAVSFQESFHNKCGDKDFKCTSWIPHEKFGHTRDVSFQHPIKIYFGARFGSCQESQRYRVYRNCHLIIDTSQDINDVPYGDYFSVEGCWVVATDGNDSKSGCILRVYTNVAFSKKTMWRGKIVQSTIEECREVYGIWMELAHEVLKQKNLEKEQDDVLREKQAKAQQLVESNASDVRMPQPEPDGTEMNQNLNGNFGVREASSGSLFGDGFAKLSSLKHQNTWVLLLVLTIAVIVLMQLSILVLLSRPQRIHVVPQSDYASGLRGGEAVAALSKQIKYLKEEMHFVENLLEKLQNEHGRLKGKLKESEIFGNQRI